MSIYQFLRIFWARRVIIIAATISCVIGATIVLFIVPPRWTGTARVMMNLLKPDAVTGQSIQGPSSRVFIASQMALITDYAVAGKVADQLGWMSDPSMIRQYRARSSTDTRDFRHWLADLVIQRSKADVFQGSNILEISYSSSRADDARSVAEALRRAYMDVSLQLRRDDANRNADWYEEQAQKAKAALDTSQATVNAYERDNKIVMTDEKSDVDSTRLRALATAGVIPQAAPAQAPMGGAALQIAQVDAEIAQATKTLGPNHPEIQGLRARRASLVTLAAQEERDRTTAAARASAASASAVQAAMTQQTSKVMGERDKLNRLAELVSEVAVRRDQFNRTQAKAAELRLQAAVTDSGLSPMGGATVPPHPDFPNKPLIVLGSLALGLGMGVLVALLAELLARRVRGAEDLQSLIDAPVLGVISGPARARTRTLPRRLPGQANSAMRRKAV
jgi:uncharacterized protein involved in exopolysaccharide biosynthesis